jgi:ceramide glucosyltransferase
MSALMRKKLLDESGGIKAFGCYLAEDYFFAKSITDRGWKISISSQPAWQNSGFCDIPGFQARISRWAKLRFAMVPPTILLEPFTECMMLGICAAFSTRILFMWDPIVVFLVHLLIWCIIDWFLLRSVQNGSVPFTKFEFVLAWLFRETTAPFLFIHALFSQSIQWRQGLYRLHWGGLVEEIEISPKVKL